MKDKYVIVRFHQSKPSRIMKDYGVVTKRRAQEICSDPSTSTHNKKPFGQNWFLGWTKA